MKNTLFLTGLLASAILFSACPDPKPKNPVFETGKPFAIKQGATMQTADNNLTIRFDAVPGDSRCPVGVQCIWAGRADCVFTFTQGSTTATDTLSSGDMSQGGAGSATFGGYTIMLKGIEPPKKEGVEIAQKDYVATIEVTK